MLTSIKYLFLVLFVSLWVPAYAAVPSSLNYQGYLTDAAGAAVEGNVVVTLSLYTTEFGGVPLWSDTELVATDAGLFTVELGGPLSPFPAGLFNTPLWLGVAVDPDAEMLPRRPLTTAGFAFQADNAVSLQGQGPAAFDQAAHVTDSGNPHGVTSAQAGAASSADIVNLQSQLNAALASITALQTNLTSANATIAGLQTAVTANATAIVTETADRVAADGLQDTAISGIQANSVLALDGMLALSGGNTALFTGVNIQVVNGTGTTDGAPNGLGNLIVGYDEPDNDAPICSLGWAAHQVICESNSGVWASSHKSGSHNMIVGDRHNYSDTGGLVAGRNNNITGENASVSGGSNNTASESWASVSGGSNNTAHDSWASVSGGSDNFAYGSSASISGGSNNTAVGSSASVSGGKSNTAGGDATSVSGGFENYARGFYTSISGGANNSTSSNADQSSIAGGDSNRVTGLLGFVGGGFNNLASGPRAVVTGGDGNVAGGSKSVVSGGFLRSAPSTHDWRAGDLFETN